LEDGERGTRLGRNTERVFHDRLEAVFGLRGSL
jgi:hypothetical protein